MSLPSNTEIATFQSGKPITVPLDELATAIGVPTAEAMAYLATAADTAIYALEALADDGVVTANEKQTRLIPLDSELDAIWQALDSRASIVASDIAVQPARDVARSARGAWRSYRDSLVPAWNDTTTDTNVDRATFDGRLENYRLALTHLADALRQAASRTSYWSGTYDDDGNRPEDGATKGAPDGTLVGSRLAEELIAGQDITAQGLIEQALRQDDAQRVMDARTFVEGQPVGVEFETFRQEQTDATSALESSLTLLGAKSADGTAWNLSLGTVHVTPDKTLAQRFDEIGATTGALTASVQTLNEAIVTPAGAASSRAVLKATAGGAVAGIVLIAQDGTLTELSEIGLMAGVTKITDQQGNIIAEFNQDADGSAYIPDLKVGRLAVNTAMVPTRSVDASAVVGTFSGAQSTDYTALPDPVEVPSLTKTITVPAKGWVDVVGYGKLDLPSGNAPWKLALSLNGAIIPESRRGGDAPNDAFAMAGSVLCEPGTYTLRYLFIGHTTVTLSSKSLFANGFPDTE